MHILIHISIRIHVTSHHIHAARHSISSHLVVITFIYHSRALCRIAPCRGVAHSTAAPYRAAPRLTAPCRAAHRPQSCTAPRRAVSCRIASCRTTLHHIKQHHIACHRIASQRILLNRIASHGVASHRVTSHHITSYHITSHHNTSRHDM